MKNAMLTDCWFLCCLYLPTFGNFWESFWEHLKCSFNHFACVLATTRRSNISIVQSVGEQQSIPFKYKSCTNLWQHWFIQPDTSSTAYTIQATSHMHKEQDAQILGFLALCQNSLFSRAATWLQGPTCYFSSLFSIILWLLLKKKLI